MENTQKKFFDLVNRFIKSKLLHVTKEFTKNDDKYSKEELEEQVRRFYDESMHSFVKEKTKISGVLLNDGTRMIVGGEIVIVERKEFVEFMKDIYEELEHKRLRDLANLQENIAKIDFIKELDKRENSFKPIDKDLYDIISNYGKMQ